MVMIIACFQIDPYKPDYDDTSVNGIRLLCKQAWDGFPEADSVTSATMIWGEEQNKLYCPDDYWIVAFRVSNKHDITHITMVYASLCKRCLNAKILVRLNYS